MHFPTLSLVEDAPASIGAVAASPAGAGGRPKVPDDGALLTSLRQLGQFRSIAIGAQLVAIAVAYAADLALQYAALVGIVMVLGVVNVFLVRRVSQGVPVSAAELFAQHLVDLAAFTGMLLLSGGAANPFVLLFFLHVALMALMLPARYVAVGTALVLMAFAITAEWAPPLVLRDGSDIPPALLGAARWVSFGLAAAMIAWFVARITAALQSQRWLLEDAAREARNNEAMLCMGTIAAGAAHELGSPLMSMSTIVHEWQRTGVERERRRDVEILASQIDACKDALARLRTAAKAARLESCGIQPLSEYLDELAGRCRAMRPGVDLRCTFEGPLPGPAVHAEPALKQAIMVLLDNAAEVSPHHVHMAARWDTDMLELSVSDRGPGIAPSRLADLGRIFFTTKAPCTGNGLGVMLTASTVARLGGRVTWTNRPEGGACAHVHIPLASLQRNDSGG